MEQYTLNHAAVEFDPMCDKENPQKISFEDVSAAAFRIQSGIVKTPCVKSHMSLNYNMGIYLKNDFLQHTGSFKERGARNALLLLSAEAKQKGVISASLGNHAQGLSYHANLLKIPATVVMPNVAPIMKIQKCQSYGAEVLVRGHDMKDAKNHAMMLAKEKGLTYINGYDHPHIMAGQGTIGLEIVEQVPDLDAVLVPVGGGGLLAGVATAVKHLQPHVLIYGVETEKCPSMHKALKTGEPTSVTIKSTLADGLAVPTVGYNAFVTAKSLLDKLITVNEDWLARAILRLVEQEKYVVEGGGAVGVAAIMAGLVPELLGKKVVCILTGGNIDTTILGRCLERGLAAEHRLVKFKVTVSDRPGGIAELCKLIASIGVSIKDIMQERAWVYGDIFSVKKDDVEYDPWCDPDNPRQIEYEDVLAASRRIAGAVVRTPCPLSNLSEKLGMQLYMKHDFLQYTGSFKERGVRNTMLLLDDEQKRIGVVAASTGNHAQAMSYHTTDMEIPCAVVMPQNSPITKVSKCERYGAKTILHGHTLAEAKRFAMALAKEKKMLYVNGFDHPHIVAGQGTAGIEIIQEVPDVEAVLVPVGGGSLLCGVAVAIKHLKPDTEIYGIGTNKCHAMMDSVKQKDRTVLEIDCSVADGLAVNKVGVNPFFNIMNGGLVDKMVQVKEEWVTRALMHIVENERIIVEGAAAVGVAAIMAGLLPNLKGKKVVTILSGGNIDTTILSRALERGMAAEGRLVKFKVTVTDRPGGMAELCTLLADIGVSIKDCTPERAWVKADIFSVQFKVLCETKGWDHTNKLVDVIKRNYKEYLFTECVQDKSSKRGPCLARNPICMRK